MAEVAAKKRFALYEARQVAAILTTALEPYCERLKVAGSVRRGRPEVGDIELLIIPKMGLEDSGDLFGTKKQYSRTDKMIWHMVAEKVIEYRPNKLGSFVDGEKIKLLRHWKTQIPIDIFITNEESWWNYLVCRTGPKESNMNIAKRARSMGLKWEPYSSGFLHLDSGERIVCKSEQEVFEAVDLNCPYRDNPKGAS